MLALINMNFQPGMLTCYCPFVAVTLFAVICTVCPPKHVTSLHLWR